MPPEAPVRVYLADDHPLFLDGLARAIAARAELALVGTSGNGREALTQITALRPAVAVLDLRMPGLDGSAVLNAVVRDALPTRVLVLSAHVESTLVYDVLAAGASGYLSKLAGERVVCEAIETIATGGSVLPQELQPGFLEQLRHRGGGERVHLTERELEVLHHLTDGDAVPRIAVELHLSPATVRTHLQNVYSKLGVSTQAGAVAAAMRLGLLE